MLARPLLSVLLVAAVGGCGGGSAGTGAASPTASGPSPQSTPPAPSPGIGCDGEPLPPRRSSLVRLEPDGQQRWRAELPAPRDHGSQAPPVTDGTRAYFATDEQVRAADDATGQPLWEVPIRGPVHGMWLDSGLLVVLDAQVSDDAQVLGIDPASGQVRWRHDVEGRGLLADQVLTGDGGLAYSLDQADARTQVLDLASGRVRWTSPRRGQVGSPAAGGGLVLRGEGKGVRAYDSRTGQLRWRAEGLSDALALEVVGDVVVVSQTAQGLDFDGSVVGLRVRDGSRAWTRLEREPRAVGGQGPAGTVTYLTASGRPAYELLDTATGRPRWSAQTQIALYLPALVTADAVVTVEGGTSQQRAVQAVRRAATDGAVLWTSRLPQSLGPPRLLGTERVLLRTVQNEQDVVLVLDLRDGRELERIVLQGSVDRPAVGDLGALLLAADPMRACADARRLE